LFAGVAVLLFAGGSPTAGVHVWGALSGIGSGLGNAALVRGLALGQMSVVAPVSAVLTAALPVLVGVMLGEHLSGWAWTGIALAGPAIALVSQSGPISGFSWSDLAYGAVAGLGFSLLFVALDRAGTDAGAWPLLFGQIVALAFVTATAVPAIVGVTWHGTVPWVPALVWGAAAGVLGGAANLLFLLATGSGALAVTAVLTALYPAVTVLLAVLLLHERLSVVRGLGLLLAGIAVIAIVLG
jgi:drug/metabolite transporter (DMT)-like permease